MLAAQDVRFRSVFTSMAAQDLEYTSIGHRGHSNATSSMKGKRAMEGNSELGVCRHTSKFKPTRRFLRSNEAPFREQMFPGIPNEITWDLIVPKLSWRDLPILSSVNRAWEEAILTNRVYEERVRANSTETLIIHAHVHHDRVAFALYSARETCCFELPQIPCLPRRVLDSCECIALDGKIYVLGGYEVLGEECVEGGPVYVLDLGGGQWKWKQCANMLEPRFAFGCGVVDDKIYVFGGTQVLKDGFCKNLLRSEVYDTHKNTWSSIMPMTRSIDMFNLVVPLVAPIGKELFLYHCYVGTLGVYNSVKDEWRFVESFSEGKLVFTAEGKFYSISQSGLHVYDVEQKSWINRHTHSFAPHRPDYSAEFRPLSITAVRDELFLTAGWRTGPNRFCHSFHAKGFDTEEKKIVWQKTNCTFGVRTCNRVLQVPIQL